MDISVLSLRIFAGVLWLCAFIAYLSYVRLAPKGQARNDRLLHSLPMLTMIAHVTLFYVGIVYRDFNYPDVSLANWSTWIRIHGAIALIFNKILRIRLSKAGQDY